MMHLLDLRKMLGVGATPPLIHCMLIPHLTKDFCHQRLMALKSQGGLMGHSNMWIQTSRLSEMSDIYSLVVILLEPISGCEVIHGGLTPNIITWVQVRVNDCWSGYQVCESTGYTAAVRIRGSSKISKTKFMSSSSWRLLAKCPWELSTYMIFMVWMCAKCSVRCSTSSDRNSLLMRL